MVITKYIVILYKLIARPRSYYIKGIIHMTKDITRAKHILPNSRSKNRSQGRSRVHLNVNTNHGHIHKTASARGSFPCTALGEFSSSSLGLNFGILRVDLTDTCEGRADLTHATDLMKRTLRVCRLRWRKLSSVVSVGNAFGVGRICIDSEQPLQEKDSVRLLVERERMYGRVDGGFVATLWSAVSRIGRCQVLL